MRATAIAEGQYVGSVVRFVLAKGFGFIYPDDTSLKEEDKPDLFFHITATVGDNRKTICDGDRVSFDLAYSEKGRRAINVRKL